MPYARPVDQAHRRWRGPCVRSPVRTEHCGWRHEGVGGEQHLVASLGVLVVLRHTDLVDGRHLPLLERILTPVSEAQLLSALRHGEPHLEDLDPTADK